MARGYCLLPATAADAWVLLLQVEFSQALHPEVDGRDTEIFAKAGLLRDGAVMAHGTCLNSAELRHLAETGTAIAHCPLSNFFFGDRLLPVNGVRALGVKVRLQQPWCSFTVIVFDIWMLIIVVLADADGATLKARPAYT